MTWWVWTIAVWLVVALVAGLWLARALHEADRNESTDHDIPPDWPDT